MDMMVTVIYPDAFPVQLRGWGGELGHSHEVRTVTQATLLLGGQEEQSWPPGWFPPSFFDVTIKQILDIQKLEGSSDSSCWSQRPCGLFRGWFWLWKVLNKSCGIYSCIFCYNSCETGPPAWKGLLMTQKPCVSCQRTLRSHLLPLGPTSS